MDAEHGDELLFINCWIVRTAYIAVSIFVDILVEFEKY